MIAAIIIVVFVFVAAELIVRCYIDPTFNDKDERDL